jgi:hypothetical protein
MTKIDVGVGEKSTFASDIGDRSVLGITHKIRVHNGLPEDFDGSVGFAYFDPNLNELRVYTGSMFVAYSATAGGTTTSTSSTSISTTSHSTTSSSSSHSTTSSSSSSHSTTSSSSSISTTSISTTSSSSSSTSTT